MGDELSPGRFEAVVGTTFGVEPAGAAPVELVLASVTRLGTRAPSTDGIVLRTEPFSLVFTGPLAPILPQATYPLAHPDLGTLDVFIVPIGPQAGRMRYEAIFN